MKKKAQLLLGFLLLVISPYLNANNSSMHRVQDAALENTWSSVNPSLNMEDSFLSTVICTNSMTGKLSPDTTPSYAPKMPGEGLEIVLQTTESNTEIELPLYGDLNCWVLITGPFGVFIAMDPYDTPGDKPYTLSDAGDYTIIISGYLTQFGKGDSTWKGSEFVTQVNNFSNIGLVSLSGAFAKSQVSSVPATLPSTVTDLSYAFDSVQSYSITNLNLWDVSHVTNMAYLFSRCPGFNADISGWDVSSVTNMEGMFSEMYSFNQNIGNWNVSQVTNMSKMFYYTYNFDQDISNWDVGNVTTMKQMFAQAYAFNQNIGNWDVSQVTDMNCMFASSPFNQDIGSWNVGSVSDMSEMFYSTDFNQNISNWVVTNVSNMSYMFSYNDVFNQPIGTWNVSNVTDMSYMFSNATAFNQPLGNWNVGNVVNMSSMFNNASAFDQDIDNWNTVKVTNMSGMFSGANAFNHSIGSWNVSSVTNMSSMFANNQTFNLTLENWDVSHVTNMSNMFKKASAFNQNIGGWNVGSVIYMSEMFREASLFNQNIGSWNVGNVTNMSNMFYQATAFNQNIGNWDVSRVTNMSSMFYQATAFNQNIGNWNVGNVTSMSSMFYQASAFNQNIGSWDVSKVFSMSSMFYQASGFDQNLGNWNVSKTSVMTNMFFGVTLSTSNYDALLAGWSALTLKNNVTFNAGGSKYSQSALSSRQVLTGTFFWTITDGGPADIFNWQGTESSDWNTAANWDQNSIPTINDEVTISSTGYAPVISSSTQANCATLTINSGTTLTINSGGSLITNSASGNTAVKRVLTGTSQYHFISSPVNNANLATIFPEINQENIYLRLYNESTGNWNNIEIPATLTNGKGYSYILQSKASGITATFTGNLITNDITPTLTNDGSGGADYAGWNLLGNPFTSAIKWGQGSWNLNNVNDEVHVWYNGSYRSYVGGVGTLTDGIIPAQQGFFVKANGASPSLTIPTNARLHRTQSFYKNTISNVLRIDVSNDANEFTDAAFIRFDENATEGFDNGFDAHKLDNDPLAPMIFTEADDIRLSINSLPAVDHDQEIPLSFSAGVDGQYTITASGLESFNNNAIFLMDILTNAKQNLAENPVYTFRALTTDVPDRFKISFNSVGVEENPLQNIGIYTADGAIILQLPSETNAQVSVINTGGQIITRKNIKGSGNIQINAQVAKGIYVVALTTNSGTITRKVFIN